MSDTFFSSLSPTTMELVQTLMAEPLIAPKTLKAQVETYREEVRAAAENNANVDLELAMSIAGSCLSLLATIDGDTSESHHRLVQLACRYFVEEEDEDGDLDSVIGFDDDAEVVNLVAGQLGLDDLKISGLPGSMA